MSWSCLVSQAAFFSLIATAQHVAPPASGSLLPPATALPIVFTSTVDADRVKVGDTVLAKTIQVVRLSGQVLPSGALLHAHIVAAIPAPKRAERTYAAEKSQLGIHFDLLTSGTLSYPLNIYVRAMADPIDSWIEPFGDTKWDPVSTVVQIGGDALTPSQTNVISRDGEVVAKNIKGGVFGHLRSAHGNSANDCDASNVDVSLAIFSASACGLYGFAETQMEHSGLTTPPSTLILSSRDGPAKIWKGTTALLEVRQP